MNYDVNDAYISLHDCYATSASYENKIVTFVFEDGFWILNNHPLNTSGKTVRTGLSKVEFILEFEEEVNIYTFEESFKKTIRKEWKMVDFIEYINNQNNSLEFLYMYKGYRSLILECCLHSNKKPYLRECEIKLSYSEEKYWWDTLREDQEW